MGFTGVFMFVLFIRMISKKSAHQTWHRNVPRWVRETHIVWGRKVCSRSRVTKKHCQHEFLHSYECWLVVAFFCIFNVSLLAYGYWPVFTNHFSGPYQAIGQVCVCVCVCVCLCVQTNELNDLWHRYLPWWHYLGQV